MSLSCRNLYVVLGAGALLGLMSKALAVNWQLLPRIEGGGTYNDNYRMAESGSSVGKRQVYGPYIDAQLNAELLSPRGKFEIVPRVRSDYYPSDTADQSTDEFLDMDGEYKWLRSDLKGLAHYSNETVIYSELPPATFAGVALGQTVGGTYGRVGIRNRRQMERVVPDYTYDITQRTHLDVWAQYQHASFSKTLIQQIGFTDYSGRIGMLFDVTPRSTISVTGVASRFQPQVGGRNANRYGVELKWGLTHSQVVRTYLRFGADRVQTDTALGTVSTSGFSGGAGVEWRYQITEVVLDVLHDFAPSSAGSEVVRDELRFRVLHAFRPRFSGFLGARAVRLRGVSNQVGLAIQGEDYFAGGMGIDYQVTMSYRIEATYDYTWQRFQGEPHAASNAVTLSFIYQPLNRYEPLPQFTGIPQQEP